MTPPHQGYSTWQNNTNPCWWKDPGLRKNVACVAIILNAVFTFGYDGSLLNAHQGMPAWQSFFNHPIGSDLGLISASYYLPKIVFPVLISYLNERFGRRYPMLAGAVLCILGALITAFATGRAMLIGGRAVLGVGTVFHSVTAPPLILEFAHPRIRPICSGVYLSFYYVGSVVASWTCFGLVSNSAIKGNWTWRLPALLQALGPVVIVCCFYWLPESPRWLMQQGREAEAIAFYEAHHANGASIEVDELVRNEVAEIRESMEFARRNKSEGYSSFFKTPGNRHRLLIIITVGMATQLSGNGIVSYYLPSILKLIGITSAIQVAGINGGLAIFNLVVAFLAGLSVERLGRRVLWLVGTAGMLGSFSIVAGLSGSYASSAVPAVGSAVVAFLFIFYGFYDVSMTTLPAVYIPEALPYSLRSKGMAIYVMTGSISVAFNQYVNPIALQAIAWKYYLVYVGALACFLTVMIFYFPETKGRTPEEIVFIFDKDKVSSVLPTAADALGDGDGKGFDSDSVFRFKGEKDGKQEIEHVELARR